jgi:hypothetical protein
LLTKKYGRVKTVQYAQDPPKTTKKLLRSIRAMGDDYILVKDINDAPCITERKKKVVHKYQTDPHKVMVVVKEIECWYMCGLNDKCCKKLGVATRIGNTNLMRKEHFDKIKPKNMSRIEFMQQILETYDIEAARQRNKSLCYFLEKWLE